MIAYNKTDLDNNYLVDEAQELKRAEFIDDIQFKEIKNKFPELKRNKHILLRILFGFLGSLAFISICGFVALIYFGVNYDYNKSYMYFFAFVCSTIGFLGVEFLVKQKQFGYGIDDAFLLGAQMAILSYVGFLSDGNKLVIAITAAIITAICYLRYLHVITALCFAASCAFVLIYSSFNIGAWAQTLLPFNLMILAVIGYWMSKKYLKYSMEVYYIKGVLAINSFCLVLFYISGNYLVVRQLSESLLDVVVTPEQDIPFSYFFYAFTFLVPLLYLYFSLVKKDRIMLWISIATLAFAIYSFRYYHHLLPLEVGLTCGGLILFIFTYLLIKKLEHRKMGITFETDKFDNVELLENLETLISSSQTSIKPQHTDGVKFGGGDFGGGGSGSDY